MTKLLKKHNRVQIAVSNIASDLLTKMVNKQREQGLFVSKGAILSELVIKAFNGDK